MLDKTGILTQIFGYAAPFKELNVIGAIMGMLLLIVGCTFIIHFTKQFKLINKKINHNGNGNGKVAKEIEIVHKRIDRTNQQMADTLNKLADMQADIAFIKGRMGK